MFQPATARQSTGRNAGYSKKPYGGSSSPADPSSSIAPTGFMTDQSILKKLRLRIDSDDAMFPTYKKLKIRGKDLNDLPPEVFEINELEVRSLLLVS